jgi:hypothetical protein
MNPAPDAELASVGEYNHNWIVNAMTDLVFKRIKEGFETPAYSWSAMLNPSAKSIAKVASRTRSEKRATPAAKPRKSK